MRKNDEIFFGKNFISPDLDMTRWSHYFVIRNNLFQFVCWYPENILFHFSKSFQFPFLFLFSIFPVYVSLLQFFTFTLKRSISHSFPFHSFLKLSESPLSNILSEIE